MARKGSKERKARRLRRQQVEAHRQGIATAGSTSGTPAAANANSPALVPHPVPSRAEVEHST